jgi:hypothetical protein
MLPLLLLLLLLLVRGGAIVSLRKRSCSSGSVYERGTGSPVWARVATSARRTLEHMSTHIDEVESSEQLGVRR